MSQDLKKFLYDAYGGFADDRHQNLSASNTFAIHPEAPSAHSPHIYLYVGENSHLELRMPNNIPISRKVAQIVEKRGGTVSTHRGGSLSLPLHALHAPDVAVLRRLVAAFHEASKTDRYTIFASSVDTSTIIAPLARLAMLLDEFQRTR